MLSSGSIWEENIYIISNVTIVIKIKGINTINQEIVFKLFIHKIFNRLVINVAIIIFIKAVSYKPLNILIMICTKENTKYIKAGAQRFILI